MTTARRAPLRPPFRRAAAAAALAVWVVPLLLPAPGGDAAGPAGPRPVMEAVIRIDTAGSFGLAASEVAAIYRKLEAAVKFQQNKTAWNCVAGPYFEGDETAAEIIYGLLAPLRSEQARKVRIDVLIGSAPRGEAAVAVEITIPGQAPHAPVAERVPAAMLGGGNRLRAVGDKADQLLKALMDRLVPCAVKAKVRGRHTIRHAEGGVSFTMDRTYSGDGRLMLRADGAFRGEMTLPEVYVTTLMAPTPRGVVSCRLTETGGWCRVPPAACNFAFEPDTTTVEITGRYRPEDNRLVFTSMVGKTPARKRSYACPGLPFLAGMITDPPSASDGIAQTGQLAVAFADGASVPIPPVPGVQGEWDVTLQVEYPPRTGTSRRDGVPLAGRP